MRIEKFEKYLVQRPLYGVISDRMDLLELDELINKDYTLDSFCKKCQNVATFYHEKPEGSVNRNNHLVMSGFANAAWIFPGTKVVTKISEMNDYTFNVEIKCTRCKSSTINTQFIIDDEKLIKIGQYPSVASLSQNKNKLYKKYFNDLYSEFNKGIGLASHGVGVGSFVYLRRVIEKLVFNAKSNAIAENKPISEDFDSKKFVDKLTELSDYLPSFMIENKSIYGILSKSIHELDETECLNAFDVLKMSIELILDEEIVKIEKKKKEKEVERSLNTLKGKMKRK